MGKIILIFFVSLFIIFFYLALLAKIFTGSWVFISFVADAPLAIIVSFMPPMIFSIWKNILPNNGRLYSMYGFSTLFVLILYVLAVEEYSFIFPKEVGIFSFHPVEPILFTIAALFILEGVAGCIIKNNKKIL